MFSEKFISATKERNTVASHVAAPYMRKTLVLDAVPEELSITVCGLGFYDIFVNGQKITKGLLAPYISNPDDICYYDRYDLTPYVGVGENVIGFILGNGFKNNDGGAVWDFDVAPFTGVPQLAFAVEGKIGEKKILVEADETVKVKESPIIFDDLRCGVHYDARKEIDGWCEAGFDDSDWDNAYFSERVRGIKRECKAEPIVVRNVVEAVEVRKARLDKTYNRHKKLIVPDRVFSEADYEGYLYDFGINSSGIPLLTVYNTTPGQVIELQQCDYINHKGEPSYANVFFYVNGYSQRDIYICKGAEKETFAPSFTYHGFRCSFVTGLREDQAKKDTVKYLECSSDLKERGNFTCSDETLNQLQQMARRSDLANFFYFPNDCPHREKNGWTGDVMVSAEHMLINLKAENSLREYMFNVRAAQNIQGTIPGVVPTGGWGFKWGNGPIWDNVLIEVPYQIYRYTGNIDVLKENVYAIYKYLGYAAGKRNEKGLLCYGLGDWVKPKGGKDVAPKELVDSIMIYQFAMKSAIVFDLLGKSLEKAYALGLAEELKAAIIEEYIDDEKGVVANGEQTAYVLAITHGMFSKSGNKKAVENLVREIKEYDGMHDCGMIGIRYLFYALSRNGYADLAYELIVSEKVNGYGQFVKKGMTSLPESFSVFDENGDPQPWLSLNHHFFGDISHFFISDIAGIRVNDGFKNADNIDIAPNFISALNNAKAYFESVKGRVDAAWERNGNEIKLSLVIPEGIKGEIKLPAGAVFADGSKIKEAVTGDYQVFLGV
ncbi:MAG: family 78 glycoside hydrolase catalytic domain [Clostridia bacterium]|nr:family 78 glycoside hydrolase catalytic domain [Clostridia bacterium]